MAMESDIRTLMRVHAEKEGSHLIGTIDSMRISIWLRTPTIEAVREEGKVNDLLRLTYGKFLSFDVVPPSVRMPDAQVRMFWEKSAAALNESLLGAAVAVVGQGAHAALVRSVVTVLVIASRPKYPVKVLRLAEEALSWLAARPGAQPLGAEKHAALIATIDRLIVQAGAPAA